MKHTKIFYACLAGAFMLGGCFEDTGNYDYDEPFVIGVETDATSFTVIAGTELEITPSITPADREYEYYWCVYDVNKPNPKVDTISRSKDLEYTVALAPTSYNLIYSVTDKKSGIQKLTVYGLSVNTIYTKGLYVLKEQDGHTDLDLHTDNTLLSNVIAMTNEGYSPAGSARDIAHFSNYRVYNEVDGKYYNQTVLFVASSQDMCVVLLASMKLDATFNDGLFYLAPEVVDPQTIFRNANGFGFVNNGKLYSIDTSTGNTGTFGTSAPGDYELDVHKVGTGVYGSMMFDKKNNRLVQANINSISDIVESGGQVPPVKNLNSEILFTSPISQLYAFMMLKSKINNTYQLRKLYVYAYGQMHDNMINAAYWNLDNTYPVTQGTHWAAFRDNEGLFYARGNEIYYCNVAGGFTESKQATAHDASKETITYMWHMYAVNNINKLAIATHADGKYKVYLYDVLAGTLLPNPEVYSGDGKAVKLIYVNNSVSTNMY